MLIIGRKDVHGRWFAKVTKALYSIMWRRLVLITWSMEWLLNANYCSLVTRQVGFLLGNAETRVLIFVHQPVRESNGLGFCQ